MYSTKVTVMSTDKGHCVAGIGYGIGTRLNWANGFFGQVQYEGLFYKDGIEGAAGGEVKTLIHHPSIQLGIAH